MGCGGSVQEIKIEGQVSTLETKIPKKIELQVSTLESTSQFLKDNEIPLQYHQHLIDFLISPSCCQLAKTVLLSTIQTYKSIFSPLCFAKAAQALAKDRKEDNLAAIQLYELSVRILPRAHIFFNNLCVRYIHDKENFSSDHSNSQVIGYATKAFEFDSKDHKNCANAYWSLGHVYQRKNDPETAVEMFVKAHNLCPDGHSIDEIQRICAKSDYLFKKIIKGYCMNAKRDLDLYNDVADLKEKVYAPGGLGATWAQSDFLQKADSEKKEGL